jgi:hypothetical protein
MDLSDVQISPPDNWQKFESLCLDIFRHQWDDIYAHGVAPVKPDTRRVAIGYE